MFSHEVSQKIHQLRSLFHLKVPLLVKQKKHLTPGIHNFTLEVASVSGAL